MATEQLLLAAVGSPDTWTLTAGSTKVAACQTPDDDGTSYITSPTANNSEQRFSLDDPTLIGSGDTINSVQVRIRHQRGGTPPGTIQAFLVLSTNVSFGTSTTTGAGWVDLTENISKPGGGSWTLTDLNNLVVGVRNTTNGRAVFCTTIEVIADYTATTTTYTGSGAATLPTLGASGSGTFTGPTYTGTGAADLPVVIASGTGTHTAPIYTGGGAAALLALIASGSGTFSGAIYTGSGSADLPTTTASGTGTYNDVAYTGSGAAAVPTATASGAGTFTEPGYSGVGAADIPALTASGSGTHTAPTYTGSGSSSIPALTAGGSGTYGAIIYTGSGAATLPAIAGSGSGTLAVIICTGTGDAALPTVTGSGAGLYFESIGGRVGYVARLPGIRREAVLKIVSDGNISEVRRQSVVQLTPREGRTG
jgi:hypothetical protein